jgi:hypothetical protein
VKGIILLGGFDNHQRSILVREFKKVGASIIRAHDKRSLNEDPFLHFTAAFKLASKLSKKKLVVITSSWVDVLSHILGASSVTELERNNKNHQAKVLNAWIIVSRILDRVALRHGALYFLSQGATELSDAAFRGFSNRPDVLTWDRRVTSVKDVTLTLSMNKCVQPEGFDSMNLSGNIADPKYFFVGDQINQKFKNFKHWPFHDDSASAFFINLAWSNANHENDSSVIPRFLENRGARVIALGKEATKRLQSLGITPEFSIPHPSWAKRFNKRDEYLQSLSAILQKDNSFRIQLSAAECAIPS